ncbi:HD domain-containing protein [bacterium]|nr:HD domain-containing protein [bacterium]MBU1989143.1 HD domain-containing protein [bacterium]
MSRKNNSIFSKPFIKSLFFMQNEWHQHGVFLHTLRVTYYALRGGDFRFFAAGLLHDVGKPFVAHQKEEDIEHGEYSFMDHEERSYQIIKNWFFISRYTKLIVRHHYLIRDIKKHKIKEPLRYQSKKEIWESLDEKMQEDLKRFLVYDDMGKGKKRR